MLRKETDVDYTSLSDVELLRRIVGPRVAERIYKGALSPLFSAEPKLGGREKLLAAGAEGGAATGTTIGIGANAAV